MDASTSAEPGTASLPQDDVADIPITNTTSDPSPTNASNAAAQAATIEAAAQVVNEATIECQPAIAAPVSSTAQVVISNLSVATNATSGFSASTALPNTSVSSITARTVLGGLSESTSLPLPTSPPLPTQVPITNALVTSPSMHSPQNLTSGAAQPPVAPSVSGGMHHIQLSNGRLAQDSQANVNSSPQITNALVTSPLVATPVATSPTTPAAIPIAPAGNAVAPAFVPPRAETPNRRAVQFVTTLSQRRELAEWMVQEVNKCNSSKHIASKAVKQFPSMFPGNSKANLMRASRIWKQREDLLPGAGADQPLLPGVTSRVQKQALPGRGRKRANWSDALQNDLRTCYLRLKSAGYEFNSRNLRSAAEDLIKKGGNPEYSSAVLDPRSKKPVLDCLTSRWVRAFADRFDIYLDVRGTGNIPASREHQFDLGDKIIAFHVGLLSRAFQKGEIIESDIETLGVFHFVVNPENGYTMGFIGDNSAKYGDILGGSRGMTMLLRLSGGKESKLMPPFMILDDPLRTYPLQGVPDNATDVSYRTAPNGWLDKEVLRQYFSEPKALPPLPGGRRRILFVEPSLFAGYDGEFDEILKKSNTEIRFFPPHSSKVMQPVESIRNHIREAWTKRWKDMKKSMLEIGVWNSEGKDASGKIYNAGPMFFLKLGAGSVQDVNELLTSSATCHARKVMIANGLALHDNGRWDISQLRPELQDIVTRNLEHFNGKMVTIDEKARPKSRSKSGISTAADIVASVRIADRRNEPQDHTMVQQEHPMAPPDHSMSQAETTLPQTGPAIPRPDQEMTPQDQSIVQSVVPMASQEQPVGPDEKMTERDQPMTTTEQTISPQDQSLATHDQVMATQLQLIGQQEQPLATHEPALDGHAQSPNVQMQSPRP